MACDYCDAVGHVDAVGSWYMVNTEKTDCGEIGMIACNSCATTQDNKS